MSDPARAHESAAAAHRAGRPAQWALLTVSDTRTEADDASGDAAAGLLEAAGHCLVERRITPDEPARIAACLDAWCAAGRIELVLTTGGTGIAPRDTTVEVVRAKLSAELEGFGELFRMLSYQQIGAAAMLSRAVAGLVNRPPDAGGDTFIFAMPGSTAAVRLAVERLVLPQLPHLLWLAGR